MTNIASRYYQDFAVLKEMSLWITSLKTNSSFAWACSKSHWRLCCAKLSRNSCSNVKCGNQCIYIAASPVTQEHLAITVANAVKSCLTHHAGYLRECMQQLWALCYLTLEITLYMTNSWLEAARTLDLNQAYPGKTNSPWYKIFWQNK